MKKFFLSMALCLITALSASAAITEQGGWYEAAYVKWTAVAGATDYNVYVKKDGGSYAKLDKELVRKYPTYFRADAVGLTAGSYQMKVVPVVSGSEDASAAMETEALTVVAHDRNGFAHYNRTEGVGAYKNDGTLKDNARVLYVTANTAKTVSLDMQTDSKGTMSTRTGLQDIIQAYEKGQEKRPLAIRIIGTIKAADMDAFGSSEEGLQVKGNGSGKCIANLTIEGIGSDATIHGFGILCRSISGVEFRNFAIMICMDDCLSLDTDNKNIWIHNMDFFYGGTGSAADQAKGDGTVDIKGKSSHVTVSYNHFYDSGKCSLGGMKSETTDCWMTYHHNWFDHSDSRHPRIRTAFYHVYNNYFDGNSKYGVGVTSGGSAFVENNFFRNCKYPMLISKQGTDAQGDGTFSGEAGGVIKAYNNYIQNPKQVLYYDGKQTDGKWDAVKANSREEEVTAVAFTGGTSFNSTATAEAIKAVPASAIDDAEKVQAKVRDPKFGAGRINSGDFVWKFNNQVQDPNYAVITELKSALLAYKSTLVGFADGTAISNGGATQEFIGGDGVNISQADNDKVVPEWGGDVPDDDDFEEDPFIADAAGTDMFWVGENAAQTKKYIEEGIITLKNSTAVNTTTGEPYASKFNETYAGNDTYKADHIGSLQLGQASGAGKADGGQAIFYCPNGVTSFKLDMLRTGSVYMIVEKSTDGTNYTKVASVEKGSAGEFTKDYSMSLRNKESKDPVWVRITNTSTGGLNIHGIYICQLSAGASTLLDNDIKANVTEKTLNIGDTFNATYTSSSTAAVSYSSSNSNIATVDAEGKITALAEGTVNITISQQKNEIYKGGSAVIKVTVTDPRAASALALTSDASVSIKETETSQITVSGAVGAVTYSSSNTSIATVDATGNITAIAAGKAVITVSDAGSADVKAGSVTVNVSVTKDMTGIEVCSFDATKKVPSSAMVTVSGNYSNSKGQVTYGENTYTDCVKMESATAISITPVADCKVTLVFGTAEGSKKLKLDGNSLTTDAKGQYTFSAKGGQAYSLTKGDTINLFLVIFEPTGDDVKVTSEDKAQKKVRKYAANGRIIVDNYYINGQIAK